MKLIPPDLELKATCILHIFTDSEMRHALIEVAQRRPLDLTLPYHAAVVECDNILLLHKYLRNSTTVPKLLSRVTKAGLQPQLCMYCVLSVQCDTSKAVQLTFFDVHFKGSHLVSHNV